MLTNKNTLYITSKNLTYDGLIEWIQPLILDAIKVINHDYRKQNNNISNQIVVNNPRKGGESANYCYVWVKSPEVANVLLGLNPDGTRRVTLVAADEDETETFDWSAPVEKEVEEGPLIIIPAYKDDPIFIGRSEIYPGDFSLDTLFCPRVHPSISEKDILDIFRPYNVSGKGKLVVKIKTIKTGRIATVEFPRNTTDAVFAQQMCMFSSIKGITLMFKRADLK